MANAFAPTTQTVDIRPIPRATTFAIDKGGVGKTSCSANVAGQAASAGYKTLIIDLDPVGSLHSDLGYPKNSGTELFDALRKGNPLPILEGIRPNLDVVVGGEELRDLQGILFSRGQSAIEGFASMLSLSLGAIADPYDLIVIDTPPGDPWITEGALCVSSALVIPTRSDDGSLDAVENTAHKFMRARHFNPDLRLAGALLFGIGSMSRRIARQTRERLDEMLGDAAPVFNTRIRYQETAAIDARRQGKLIHELSPAVQEAVKDRLLALQRGESPDDANGLLATNVGELAKEYTALTQEVLTRLTEIEEEISNG
ncbi:ParA family protein [Paeniglutamicibacter sp. MACA_103]|uniref:ParA family protein n=1 Tax=Paeniglutamicibacter sp. MACA_103 TaxID=3377337 RepID=UPI003893FC4E